MIEEWRPIEGYEGLYEISSYGKVRSLDRYDSRNHFRNGRILKLSYNTVGYLSVGLHSNGKAKTYMVHRMVAEAFIPNPDNLPEVNHRNEDKSNNSVENLEWCDHKYNSNYGTRNDRIRDTSIKNGYWSGLSEEEYRKKYYQEHKNEHTEWNREYYQKNKDKIKKHYQENRDKLCEQQREYYKRKKRLEKMTIQEKVTSHNDEE